MPPHRFLLTKRNLAVIPPIENEYIKREIEKKEKREKCQTGRGTS